MTGPTADDKIARTEPGTIYFIKEQVMRNVCLSTLGRVLVFAGAILLGGMARPAAAEDETQACNANGQAVAYGNVLGNCTIEAPGDLDIFTFVAAAGEISTVIATETGGTSFTAVCLEVRAPDNSLIAGPTCGNSTVRFEIGPLPLPGVYQIIATEGGNDGAIGFNLSLERMSPPRAPTSIGPAETITGRQILPVTDLDTFSFNANVADQFRLIITESAGTSFTAVCVEVRGPGNTIVVATTCNNVSLDLTLPPAAAAGAYQIIVTEAGDDGAIAYNLSLNCLSGTCPARPPVCLVDPSFAGNTLTLDFTISTPEPAEWHVAMLAVGSTFTLWKIPLPVVETAVSFSVPIPGFPSLDTIGFLSTYTTESGLVCTDLKRVDTGPMAAGMTPTQLRQYFPQAR